MKKFIILLMLSVSTFVSAQESYMTSSLHSYMKYIPDNDPERFWEGLHKLHRQVKAMERAKENDKPSMREALEEMGDIHKIRPIAEEHSVTSEEIEKQLALWYQLLGIKGADGNAKLFIVTDSTSNAGMYPDGTCVINTGFLSFIENIEELIGVLAHETAHLTLMHALNDKWRTIKAVKRNRIWSDIGTGLAVGLVGYGDIYAASNGVKVDREQQDRLYQQIIDAGVASKEEVTVKTNFFTRLRYMRETEEEADEAAFWFMEKNGYDPIYYINYLKRYYDSLPANQKKASKKQEKYSTHPDTPKRIKKLEWLYKKYHGK